MQTCQFHPLNGASYQCPSCHTDLCQDCINDDPKSRAIRCFICEQELESLGAVNTVTPFWRRLEQSFRYPLCKESLLLISAIAILAEIVWLLPMLFGFIAYLALFGSLLKYAFTGLKNTADGDLVPPNMEQAYQGGLGVAGSVIVMILILLSTVYASTKFFGPTVGNIIGIFVMIGLPAVIILYAMTESILESVNTVNMLKLITTIGLPYGLLLGFMMIMFASAGVVGQMLSGLGFISSILESVVLNYYLIVSFHLMGYMVFQYQDKFGFIAHSSETETLGRDDKALFQADVNVHLNSGEFEHVNKRYLIEIKSNKNDLTLLINYFKFLVAVKNQQSLIKFSDQYFNALQSHKREDLITTNYKQLLLIAPHFKPDTAELRHNLAQELHNKGEPKLAAKLLNGMHKEFLDYPQLAQAYTLLAECFDDLPGLESKAEKCRALVKKLELRNKTQNNQSTNQSAATKSTVKFDSIDSQISQQAERTKKAVFQTDEADSGLLVEDVKTTVENDNKDDDNKSKDLPPLDFY
jgi:hypothetical protein